MAVAPAPLRLAVDLSHLLPGGANGGIKIFLLELLGWLGRQRRVPLQFIYLTRSQTHAEVRDTLARPQDTVICVRDDRDGTLPREISRLPRERVWIEPPGDLAWQLRADVLYCPFGPPEFACAGVPTLCLIADVLHRDFPATLSPGDIAQREEYFRRVSARADAIQCISHFVEERMRALYEVPADRLFTTHLAIQSRLGSCVPREDFPAAAEPFFLYPANAWAHKNHEVLLLSYRIYRRRALAAGRTPWRLELTGHDEPRWQYLQAVARSLGLESSVSFRGFVRPAELAQLWRHAGALVFPSLHEGFGIPLLEAMRHGVPILTSTSTSLPEVGGEACLYADARRPEALADAMERLATDPAVRADLVRRGAARLTDFEWTREAGRVLDRMVDLAAGRAWRPRTLGVSATGWMKDAALLALPKIDARCQLEIATTPVSRAHRIRLSAGEVPLGVLQVPRRAPAVFRADFHPGGGPLRLLVHRKKSWFPFGQPRRAARLASARIIRPDGSIVDLLEPA